MQVEAPIDKIRHKVAAFGDESLATFERWKGPHRVLLPLRMPSRTDLPGQHTLRPGLFRYSTPPPPSMGTLGAKRLSFVISFSRSSHEVSPACGHAGRTPLTPSALGRLNRQRR